MTLRARRQATDRAVRIVSTGFAILSLATLAWILLTLILRGGPAIGAHVFTLSMMPPGAGGGMLNAIVGSLMQLAVALTVAAPVGVMAGTYLAQARRNHPLALAVGFTNDVLLSAPSILIGLFVYQIAVKSMGGFSGWAGAGALAILILPVVVRTTESMLALVPVGLSEAAYALGAPRWKVSTAILWRAARTGIVTGILLALARAAGETAPLLFTSLGNNGWSFDMSQPMASLPVAIYQYAGSPFNDWVALAWAGALLITSGVLALNVLTHAMLAKGGGAR
jgi:phosphate transport system permease protein